MKTVQDFLDKYKIKEFYKWQEENTDSPVLPFKDHQHKSLSFGIIPGFRNYDLFYERYLSAVKILKEKDLIKDGMKVLDVGSGEGFFKFFFDGMCDEKLEWHGVEVWKERAAFCRHIGYNIEEVSIENGKLPYQDESFDIVLASHVLEHLPNPKEIMAEMGRVTKKKGVIVIGTPTKPPVIAELDAWYHNRGHRDTGDTQQAFTHNSLQRMFLDALNLDKSHLIDKRGFRIFSSRKKLPIENWKWFYNISTWMGKYFKLLVPEVNIIVQK